MSTVPERLEEGPGAEAPRGATARPGCRRRVRRAAIGCGLLLLLLLLLAVLIPVFCIASPPTVDPLPAIVGTHSVKQGGRSVIGEAWLEKKDGILRMFLKGDPFTLGYCNSALTEDLLREQEESMQQLIRRFVPSKVALGLLAYYVLLRNRNLPDYLLEEHELELYGLSLGCPDPFPELGPIYHRVLNYHAAHDISHYVMDTPFVGCTSVAAWGSATSDGHLLIGRNFDFDALRVFDTNKIVIRFEPAAGLGFVSVAWPGMVGVVTGMNDAKIAIHMNAAHSSDSRTIGTPVSLVARRVLQEASTLEQAVEIIAAADVFVTDCWFLADGKTGEVAIVEKTPGRWAQRRPTGEYIVCSNHFLTPALGDDPENRKLMRDGTTLARYERMDALVGGQRGALSPEAIARILRDRVFAEGTLVGLGNEASLNAFIATHSVIMDVTDGVIWVSAGPHQLGAYVPFRVGSLESPPGRATIPADPALSDGTYERCLRSRELLAEGRRLLEAGSMAEAKARAGEAREQNPDFYGVALLLGRIALAEGDRGAARARLEEALSLHPPFGAEREEIRGLLENLAR